MAHEEGNLNDVRTQLGNDVAVKAYREGKLPFPNSTIIVALHWNYVASEESNKVFGRRNLSLPSRPRIFSLWSRTQKSTPQWAAGISLASRKVPTRRSTKPAFPQTTLVPLSPQTKSLVRPLLCSRRLGLRGRRYTPRSHAGCGFDASTMWLLLHLRFSFNARETTP